MTEMQRPDGSGLSEGLGAVSEARIRWNTAERPKGARLFLLRNGKHYMTKGWRSLADASAWIDSHGEDLDWRVGYHFRLKCDRTTTVIVNKHGEPASADARRCTKDCRRQSA